MNIKKFEDGRTQYVKWLKADREKRLESASRKYEALPPNIRAALAKVAGVPNVPLSSLIVSERRRLNTATNNLIGEIIKAGKIIASVDFTGGE